MTSDEKLQARWGAKYLAIAANFSIGAILSFFVLGVGLHIFLLAASGLGVVFTVGFLLLISIGLFYQFFHIYEANPIFRGARILEKIRRGPSKKSSELSPVLPTKTTNRLFALGTFAGGATYWLSYALGGGF